MVDRGAPTRVGPDGPIIRIEVDQGSDAEVYPGSDGEQDVTAFTDLLSFDDFTSSVASVAGAMTDALSKARPDEAEVKFGINAAIETGRLTSMLVKGAGNATFEVRLLWKPKKADSADPPGST